MTRGDDNAAVRAAGLPYDAQRHALPERKQRLVDLQEPTRILVIKLSALGNVILSLGPFAAIRQHHRAAEVTLLTTAPYAAWLAEAPWFDRVLVDQRPDWWNLPALLRLRRMLRAGHFDRVYDLQTSSRSSWYFRLFAPGQRPEWSGIAPGCSHPHRDLDRDIMHDIDRQFAQLAYAGITERPPADLSWNTADIGRFNLPARFALLVPGSSPHRPVKRWPAASYAAVAGRLLDTGITPVVLGTAAERDLATTICATVPAAIDLTGRTGLADLAPLARAAQVAIGNDTGPMHLIAAAGCRSIVLFSHDSDPERCAPRGLSVSVLRRPDLMSLPVEAVLAELDDAMTPA
jgi:ADP-heptose:LPS heptosyltransferase